MLINVWIPRPYDQALITQSYLSCKRYTVLCEPVMDILYQDVKIDQTVHYQAVLITSLHSIRTLETIDLNLPIYAVGLTTHQNVLNLNKFQKVYNADGDHLALIKLIEQQCHPHHGPLLYLHGYYHTTEFDGALVLKGFNIYHHTCYKAVAVDSLSSSLIQMIQSSCHGIITIYSKRQSQIVCFLLKKYDLELYLKNWTVIAISQSCTLSLIPLQFKRIIVANHPCNDSMVETIEQYYHEQLI